MTPDQLGFSDPAGFNDTFYKNDTHEKQIVKFYGEVLTTT
jgi:hypothetical protein